MAQEIGTVWGFTTENAEGREELCIADGWVLISGDVLVLEKMREAAWGIADAKGRKIKLVTFHRVDEEPLEAEPR